MNTYNPEIARNIYTQLQSEQDGDTLFPITAQVVQGILEGFVYGSYASYPAEIGETVHLEVPAHILRLPGWSSGIQDGVQKILDMSQARQAA